MNSNPNKPPLPEDEKVQFPKGMLIFSLVILGLIIVLAFVNLWLQGNPS